MKNQNFFSIPEYRVDEFEKRIADLNKKARKVGIPEITLHTVDICETKYDRHPLTGKKLAFPMVIRFHRIEVNGMEPKFSGWSFIARIDHDINGANIIAALPGIELDTRYRTLGPVCEHCRINRFRKITFVVRHDNGQEKQVGSSCVRDFLGHGTPEQIATFCESLFVFVRACNDNDFIYGGMIEDRYDIEGLLALTSAIIRKLGWLSVANAKEFGGTPTADIVREYIFDTGNAANEIRQLIGDITDSDKELARLTIAWVKGFSGNLTDYQYNLKTIIDAGSVLNKHLGIAVSAISGYQREAEHILKNAIKAPSQWIGNPDLGRQALKNVKVVWTNAIANQFGGTTYIYRFLANDKDVLTWFASSNQSLAQGDIINMQFRVKALQEYKGEKQTLITRAKCVIVKQEATA